LYRLLINLGMNELKRRSQIVKWKGPLATVRPVNSDPFLDPNPSTIINWSLNLTLVFNPNRTLTLTSLLLPFQRNLWTYLANLWQNCVKYFLDEARLSLMYGRLCLRCDMTAVT
jgi:hypothetical protein